MAASRRSQVCCHYSGILLLNNIFSLPIIHCGCTEWCKESSVNLGWGPCQISISGGITVPLFRDWLRSTVASSLFLDTIEIPSLTATQQFAAARSHHLELVQVGYFVPNSESYGGAQVNFLWRFADLKFRSRLAFLQDSVREKHQTTSWSCHNSTPIQIKARIRFFIFFSKTEGQKVGLSILPLRA